MHENDRPQWVLTLTIYHGPKFGHCAEVNTTSPRGPLTHDSVGSWRGLGVPESVLDGITAFVTGAIEEHMLTRYGIQGELAERWAGEPDPF